MKVYTKTGDQGTCALYDNQRVEKDDIRIEVLGTLDEVNSTLGFLRVTLASEHPWQIRLQRIQIDLMDMMSHLACAVESKRRPSSPLPLDGAAFCEQWIDQIEASLSSPSEYFLLPGGNSTSALCHLVRTQFRRGERQLVTLQRQQPPLPEGILPYVNRLSDLFFMLSRQALEDEEIPEERWRLFHYKKRS